jgi:hypothetical protein
VKSLGSRFRGNDGYEYGGARCCEGGHRRLPVSIRAEEPSQKDGPPQFSYAKRSGSLPSNSDDLVAIGVTKISEISSIWALALDADAVEFGALMTASHASLRDDYAVSVPALDDRGCFAPEVGNEAALGMFAGFRPAERVQGGRLMVEQRALPPVERPDLVRGSTRLDSGDKLTAVGAAAPPVPRRCSPHDDRVSGRSTIGPTVRPMLGRSRGAARLGGLG